MICFNTNQMIRKTGLSKQFWYWGAASGASENFLIPRPLDRWKTPLSYELHNGKRLEASLLFNRNNENQFFKEGAKFLKKRRQTCFNSTRGATPPSCPLNPPLFPTPIKLQITPDLKRNIKRNKTQIRGILGVYCFPVPYRIFTL